MKKVLFTFAALLFVGLVSSFAQNASDTIAVEKNRLYYHGLQIESMRQMKSIVANDELALKEVKKASVVAGFSDVISYIGGFAIGYELGSMIYGRFNPYVFGGGIAVAGLGIGLGYLANSQLKKGAAIYNENLGKTSCGDPIQLDFGLMPGGLGLTLSF